MRELPYLDSDAPPPLYSLEERMQLRISPGGLTKSFKQVDIHPRPANEDVWFPGDFEKVSDLDPFKRVVKNLLAQRKRVATMEENRRKFHESLDFLRPDEVTEVVDTYGLDIEGVEEMTQYDVEKHCFRINHTREKGGLGRYGHFRNAIRLAFDESDFKYNDYADKMVRAFCEHDLVNVWGSGGVGKSTTAAAICVVYWDCAPSETLITLFTSALNKHDMRAFGEVVRLFHALKSRFPKTPGRLVESQYKIVYDDPDKEKKKKAAGIFAFGTANSDDRRKVNALSGVHNIYNLRIIDEWNACDPAVIKNLANMFQGGKEARVFGMANPDDWNDLHGKHSIPEEGIASISTESECWMSTTGFYVLFLHGLKCPSLVEENGEEKYPFFPTREGIAKTKKLFGEDSLEWWQQVIGFMPPTSTKMETVLTRPLVNEMRIQRAPRTGAFVTRIAGFDPASTEGGDAKILSFADVFLDALGRKILVASPEQESIQIPVSDEREFTLELSREVIRLCKERSVSKEHLGVDISGTDGCADTIDILWDSPEHVHRVNFQGPASPHRISTEDVRTGDKVYDRRVTELWMVNRPYVLAQQVWNIPEAALEQLCRRRVLRNRQRYSVETKKEMRATGGGSPNEADSFVVMLDVFREVLGVDPAEPVLRPDDTPTHQLAAQMSNRRGAEKYEDPFANLASDDVYSEESWDY